MPKANANRNQSTHRTLSQLLISLKSSSLMHSLRKCYIHTLPDEVLISVFSHLDTKSLKVLPAVCKRFHRVLTDESCWRSAFLQCWGKKVPHRRIRSTWRDEFLVRTALRRDFSSVKTTSIIASPGLGNLVSVAVPREHPKRCFMASETGIVGRCDHSTGKIERQIWDGGFGNVGAGVRIWGNRFLHTHPSTTAITLTTNVAKDASSHSGAQLTPLAGHLPTAGAIRVVSWSGSKYVATGTEHGEIKVWEVEKWGEAGSAIWTGHIDNIEGGFQSICLLSASQVVATTPYYAYVFSVPAPAPLEAKPHMTFALPPPGTSARVLGIRNTLTALVPTGRGEIWLIDTATCQKVGVLKGLHAPVTALSWDIGAGSDDNETPLSPQLVTSPFMETHFPRIVMVAAGDEEGHMCTWNLGSMACTWRQEAYVMLREIHPTNAWRAHFARILHVRLDAVRLVTSCADGTLKLHDVINAQHLRTMNSKYFKSSTSTSHSAGNRDNQHHQQARELYDPNDRKNIKDVGISSDFRSVVIAIGEHLRTWTFGTSPSEGRRRSLPGAVIGVPEERRAPTINGIPVNNPAAVAAPNANQNQPPSHRERARRRSLDLGENKKQLQHEIKRETRTTLARLEREREARWSQQQALLQQQQYALANGGGAAMSEEEALQLAMTMSLSEVEHRHQTPAIHIPHRSGSGGRMARSAPASAAIIHSRSFDDRNLAVPPVYRKRSSDSFSSLNGDPLLEEAEYPPEEADGDSSLSRRSSADVREEDEASSSEDSDYDSDLEDLHMPMMGINISNTGAANAGRHYRRQGSGHSRRQKRGGAQRTVSTHPPHLSTSFPSSSVSSSSSSSAAVTSPRQRSDVPGTSDWVVQRRHSQPDITSPSQPTAGAAPQQGRRPMTEAEQLAYALALSRIEH